MGTLIGAVADTSGKYRVPHVPVGVHTVRAGFIGYRLKQVTGVTIGQGRITRLDFILDQSDEEVSEIVPSNGAP